MQLTLPSALTELSWPPEYEHIQAKQSSRHIKIFCKRDDLIHPVISGNKWRKLKNNIDYIKSQNYKHILSFGGPYSNHLHALGFICKTLNIKLSACIRGNYHQNLSPMLKDLLAWDVKLHYLSKLDYKKRTESAYCRQLQNLTGAEYIIPEGGSNQDCLAGMTQLYKECIEQSPNFTHIVTPVASGGTLAGICHGENIRLGESKLALNCGQHFATKISSHVHEKKLVGIAMLKGEGYLESIVNKLLIDIPIEQQKPQLSRWEILHQYHHGGYAKSSQELTLFVERFNRMTDKYSHQAPMKIEPVYSGKLFFAIKSMIEQDAFLENSIVLAIHTGGLQGNRQNII